MANSGRPPVYADEDVSRRLVDALRARGFDVLTAAEAGTLGQTDQAQLVFAAASGRVLLTFNRRHFRHLHATWRAQGGQHAGIVLLPKSTDVDCSAVRASMLLDALATHATGEPAILNWNELQVRLHRGERVSGYDENEVRLALGEARRSTGLLG